MHPPYWLWGYWECSPVYQDGDWNDIHELVGVYRHMGCYAFGRKESDSHPDEDEDDIWVTDF
jgi:hypothetical protein